jgi:glycosyltransferase involved in cell wall biosynthesis
MALGKAIIASDLGPRSEKIADGLSGLLFKAGNVADLLAEKMDRVIADQY